MKILIVLEGIYPTPGNNALVLSSLLPILREEHEVFIFATQFALNGPDAEKAPMEWCGCRVFYPRRWAFPGILGSVVKKISQPLYETVGTFLSLRREIAQLDAQWHFDGVITHFRHEKQVFAALTPRTKGKILYILDPIRAITDKACPRLHRFYWKRILSAQRAVLTTPFIREGLLREGLAKDSKIIPVAFPKVTDQSFVRSLPEDGFCRLLFCGWLYSDIRSPEYFLKIVSRLDERFIVTFMGRECQKLTEQYEIHTRAKLITLPHQPYEVAMQAMADADVLINIGNSVPVHLPSKTLEYINSGKPIVNFYKLEDCPTLYYTRRYPLCLNLPESQPDIDAAAKRFTQFCLENKGRTLERSFLEKEFADCTPQYIAEKMNAALGTGQKGRK